MKKIETYPSGKVVNGTFSKKNDKGYTVPTALAIEVVKTAMEIQQVGYWTDDFTIATKEAVMEVYGLEKYPMLLKSVIRGNSPVGGSLRRKKVDETARMLAYQQYTLNITN